MIGSLYAGISGLSANAKAMTVVGDNIANVNTTAFKSNRSTFANILSQSLGGASGNEIGRGVEFWGVNSLWTQGTLENTSSPTDLAVNGKGFFVLNDSAGSEFYTRAGIFSYDNYGNLVNPDGMYVQGYQFDSVTGEVGNDQTDITISGDVAPPQATDEVAMTMNLDASALPDAQASVTVDCTNANSDVTFTAVNIGDAGNDITVSYVDPGIATGATTAVVTNNNIVVTLAHDGTNITATASDVAAAIAADAAASALVTTAVEGTGLGVVEAVSQTNLAGGSTAATYSNTMTVYDSLGNAIPLTIDYVRMSTGWDWTANPADGVSTSSGTIQFDSSGNLVSPATNPVISITGVSSGAADLNIEWSLTDNDNGGVTGFSALTDTSFQSQNGFSSGSLQGVSVDESGIIMGMYTNGQIVPLYQVALADFSSYSGLGKLGKNLYTESLSSGPPLEGIPGSGRLGNIAPSSLEMSNVDLASEFVKMITTQRAFQANSRVITTSDEILNELINIKR